MVSVARLSLALVLALLVTGCTSTHEAAPESEKVVYDYVYETGSILPKKVRRDKAVDRTQNLQSVSAANLERMERDQMLRNQLPSSPGGP